MWESDYSKIKFVAHREKESNNRGTIEFQWTNWMHLIGIYLLQSGIFPCKRKIIYKKRWGGNEVIVLTQYACEIWGPETTFVFEITKSLYCKLFIMKYFSAIISEEIYKREKHLNRVCSSYIFFPTTYNVWLTSSFAGMREFAFDVLLIILIIEIFFTLIFLIPSLHSYVRFHHPVSKHFPSLSFTYSSLVPVGLHFSFNYLFCDFPSIFILL